MQYSKIDNYFTWRHEVGGAPKVGCVKVNGYRIIIALLTALFLAFVITFVVKKGWEPVAEE